MTKQKVKHKLDPVICGGWVDPQSGDLHYLKHRGPTHTLCFAPTRSGKGVSLILPTFLSGTRHEEGKPGLSIFASDIKGELWRMTSAYRKALGHSTVFFAPAALQIELDERGQQIGPRNVDGGLVAAPECGSARFNPLNEIRIGTVGEIRDAQNVAEILMTGSGAQKEGSASHWVNTSIDLCQGLIVHLLYSRDIPSGQRNLAGLLKLLSELALLQKTDEDDMDADPMADALRAIGNAQHASEVDSFYWQSQGDSGEKITTHPAVRGMAGRMLAKAERERGSVLSTAMAALALFQDPVVAYNTSASDFCLRDLMHAERPVSFYLVLPPGDMERLRPLARLLITQLIGRLTESIDAKPKHQLLMLLDEFPALGKLDIVRSSIAFTAGYGIRYFLITQNLSQLKSTYGPAADEIVANCHIRLAFAPNEVATAELLSKWCGTSTIHQENISTSKDSLVSPLGRSHSLSHNALARPLLTPDEVMRLPAAEVGPDKKITRAGAQLIFVAGSPPIMGTQSLFFKDPVWVKRAYNMESQQGPRPLAQSDRLAAQVTAAVAAPMPSPVAQRAVPVHKAQPASGGGNARVEPTFDEPVDAPDDGGDAVQAAEPAAQAVKARPGGIDWDFD